MSDSIKLDIDKGVAVITLNRPESLNAITPAMGHELEAAFAQTGTDPNVRVILIAAEGRAFCAGADTSRLSELADAKGTIKTASQLHSDTLAVFKDAPVELRHRCLVPHVIEKPVIAAIKGHCLGIGLVLACACDIRFADTTALFSPIFSRRGLVAEGDLAWTLPRLVGHGAATEMLLSGRRIAADEALRIGLVSRVIAPEDLFQQSLDYARDITRNASPRSMRIIKRQLTLSQTQTHEEAIRFATREIAESLKSADFREGVEALKQKRAPNFPAG